MQFAHCLMPSSFQSSDYWPAPPLKYQAWCHMVSNILFVWLVWVSCLRCVPSNLLVKINPIPAEGGPGRLWSLLLWRYSRPAWTRSSAACCRFPCFGRGVGLDDPQRSLPTPNILWSCDSVNPEHHHRALLIGLCSWAMTGLWIILEP